MQTYLQSFNILSPAEIEIFMVNAVPRTLKKGEFFITENKICEEVAFIKSGILRSYYTAASAEEYTYCLTFPNQFMTAYSSLITGNPTVENIQAMSDVDLLIIKKEVVDALAESSINGLKLLKIIAEQQYLHLEKRVFMYQKNAAKARYVELFKSHPDYIKKIPVKYLASFLAITPRHLSRLRKEII
ncbi:MULTISPECIES: Crp/Fnr family transcriptional regulator [unclassified Pedobacter]|uniref:Crp/Fnr family transcriptional regulator n=1 Tax=unclassified Pedobacter TaxID=2628915 RepID=UPI00142123EC|nr:MULTISPECIES: Crp/Fnr family transcriptional regulator [unclassified Pedobacter]NII84868.1 CRP-like cAMP-binding protein [Pedobacter sp. SG908]NMN38224.1 CRP-like cAMP-binding protein [Pedobacter sp. SG918]